jgi:hypothetical protein
MKILRTIIRVNETTKYAVIGVQDASGNTSSRELSRRDYNALKGTLKSGEEMVGRTLIERLELAR